MKKTLIPCLLLAVPSFAQAALTLTVNSSTKTLSWTGSEMIENIVVGQIAGQTNVGITTVITNTFNGGTFATSAVSSGLGLSVGIVSGIDVVPPSPITNPALWVNTTNSNGIDSISVLLGLIIYISGTDQTSYTVTANPGSFDYSTLDVDQEAFLESNDGTRLFFSDTLNQSDLGDAGVISVIPEPHSVLLSALGILGFIFKRKRRS